jgi:hypothetical protein
LLSTFTVGATMGAGHTSRGLIPNPVARDKPRESCRIARSMWGERSAPRLGGLGAQVAGSPAFNLDTLIPVLSVSAEGVV